MEDIVEKVIKPKRKSDTKRISVKKSTSKDEKKSLVIVESPAKAKTIEKFLGSKKYTVVASVGHIRDLPKSKMGINVENDYEPEYITIRGKGGLATSLKKEAKKANHIFLATDPDREGEAISWHLANILNIDINEKNRIEFNEITKDAVTKAIKSPRAIDINLVNAQQARRVIDRLVGYKISPILWAKVRRGLSAGRVQSVATKLIVDREKEINKFEPVEFWDLDIKVAYDEKNTFSFPLYSIDNKKINDNLKEKNESIISKQDEIEKIVDEIKNKEVIIKSVDKKTRKRYSPKPFTTSTLQQDAATKLNFSTKRTMIAAQQLYEGIDVKRGKTEGLITYIRTDSQRISEEAMKSIKEYIVEEFGEKNYKPYEVKNNKKKIQDAHECIRPSDIRKVPSSIASYLKPDQLKLYTLIWQRTVAALMADAEFEVKTIIADIEKYSFKTSGSKLIKQGFLQAYEEFQSKEVDIPDFLVGYSYKVKKVKEYQHFTQPPNRYNEASLVKSLEELGIGRPSTYAPTISTILQRGYVIKKTSVLHPTELGEIVTTIMEENFQKFIDLDFTAKVESELDAVEEGDVVWKNIIRELYPTLDRLVKEAGESVEKVLFEEETDEECEICGAVMVIKHGRFGKFMACKNYPECKNTKPLLERIGVKCPVCNEGDVIIRKTKKNRIFYGCSTYPKCKFVSWDRPTGELCKICSEHLVEKKGKNDEKVVCSNRSCGKD
ncbi:MAG: type I DNA topoisomerase [Filifactoraceae bacterium]